MTKLGLVALAVATLANVASAQIIDGRDERRGEVRPINGYINISYRDAQDIILKMYRGALMREPDSGGQQFWINTLVQARDEQAVRQIARDFLYNAREFSDVVYRNGDRRVADSILNAFNRRSGFGETDRAASLIRMGRADDVLAPLMLDACNGGGDYDHGYIDITYYEAQDVANRMYRGALGREGDYNGLRNMADALDRVNTVEELRQIVRDFLYKWPEFDQHVRQVGSRRVADDMMRQFNSRDRDVERAASMIDRGNGDTVLLRLIRQHLRK